MPAAVLQLYKPARNGKDALDTDNRAAGSGQIFFRSLDPLFGGTFRYRVNGKRFKNSVRSMVMMMLTVVSAALAVFMFMLPPAAAVTVCCSVGNDT